MPRKRKGTKFTHKPKRTSTNTNSDTTSDDGGHTHTQSTSYSDDIIPSSIITHVSETQPSQLSQVQLPTTPSPADTQSTSYTDDIIPSSIITHISETQLSQSSQIQLPTSSLPVQHPPSPVPVAGPSGYGTQQKKKTRRKPGSGKRHTHKKKSGRSSSSDGNGSRNEEISSETDTDDAPPQTRPAFKRLLSAGSTDLSRSSQKRKTGDGNGRPTSPVPGPSTRRTPTLTPSKKGK